MKKIMLLFLTLLIIGSTSVTAQPFQYRGWLGFDTTAYFGDSNIKIILDTTDNIWRIGEPKGKFFDGGFNYLKTDERYMERPHAIYTDKSLMKNDSGTYSFQIFFTADRKGLKTIRDHGGRIDACNFRLKYKIDASINEYLKIKISNDKGKTWHYSFFEDTIYNGMNDWQEYVGILGTSNVILSIDNWLDDFDTLLFNFEFVANRKLESEGIMIDNIMFNISIGRISNIDEHIHTYPLHLITSNSKSIIQLNSYYSNYTVSVFDITGKQIVNDLKIDSETLDLRYYMQNEGVYILSFINETSKEILNFKLLIL
ncbi:MAG: hypothetical protein U9R42_06845 [Bacteroidota bacterium]|nr:hypothetical protein [Bacteroidota bacterium]